jgi:hypothetical protein
MTSILEVNGSKAMRKRGTKRKIEISLRGRDTNLNIMSQSMYSQDRLFHNLDKRILDPSPHPLRMPIIQLVMENTEIIPLHYIEELFD